jgi:RNA 2',3'-cyclic 3'-phosphodiesterase
MRLFIALNMPKKERQRVYRAARKLRDGDLPVRWVDEDAFHITLKFLGEVRPDRVSQIEEGLGKIASTTPPFTTELAGFGAFPTIRRPHVIWLGVGASPELRCLKQDIEWTLGDYGFEAETRAFHPHVTLGRADKKGGAGAFRGMDDIVAGMAFSGELKVRSVDVMRSHLSRSGARYSLVTSVKLAG